MKRFSLRLIITFCALCITSAYSTVFAKNLFPELAGRSDVEKVYISPMAIKMAGNYVDFSTSLLPQTGSMLPEIKSLHVYTCETKEGVAAASKAIDRYIKENPWYEVIMSTEDDEDTTTIYGIPSQSEEGKCESMIIRVQDGNTDMTIVVINAK